MNQDSKNHHSGLLNRVKLWLENLLTDMAAEWAARAILYGAVMIIDREDAFIRDKQSIYPLLKAG
ncbi:hypothetical protein [Candidatus Odyssella thessalonicensis]|uniref:hypothetical protein n=1 Tax=Candidatus Odyssella thessalonicensis TaxID=84647 RepID=UPI000225C147|nr:hypothetical protein [Candidatus Odyssella thessalonicensis]